MKWVLSSKIQKAVVIGANVNYVGSITIDEDLLDRAGLWPGEKVLVVSNSSGARLETYVIRGERGTGAMYMNGAAALLIKQGEEIIIMGFTLSDKPVRPKNILVDRRNAFVRYVDERERMTLDANA
jgi:aspartate 1-decarboxylase